MTAPGIFRPSPAPPSPALPSPGLPAPRARLTRHPRSVLSGGCGWGGAAVTVDAAKMPGAVIPAWTRESRRHGWQINRLDDAGLNRQPRPTRHSGDSRSPESLLFMARANPIKDSGLRVGARSGEWVFLPQNQSPPPCSFAVLGDWTGPNKDSGFRIGEEYSRYASLFLYRTE